MDTPEPARCCPRCKTPNRAERRFCRQCGAGLCVTCARCGDHNDHGDRFCGACGGALTARIHAPRPRPASEPPPPPAKRARPKPPPPPARSRGRALSNKLVALNREHVSQHPARSPDPDHDEVTELGQADIDAMFAG